MTQTNGTTDDTALVSEKIKDMFRKFLLENKISVDNIDIKAGSIRGDNYLGIIAKAEVTGKDENGKLFNKSFIIKSAPKSEGLRNLAPIKSAYEREIYIYTHVLPEIKKIQQEKGVKTPFSSFTDCLKSSSEDKDEALIMTDMKALGYSLQNRKKALDYNHVKFIMTELARLHAVSFAILDQKPELFEEFSKMRKNLMSELDHTGFEQQTEMQLDKAQNTLDPETDKKEIERFQEFRKDYLTAMKDILEDVCDPYCVIRHGDCWTNNVLFAYRDKSQPNVPTNLCFLDWQLSHVASPVLDILYFIYACTDANLRDNHLDQLLKDYYKTLTDFAAELGSDIKKLYPYDVFMAHIEKYGRYGLYTAVMLLPLLTSDADEIPDINEVFNDGDVKKAAEAFSFKSKNDEEYNTRIRDIIKDMVKRNFI